MFHMFSLLFIDIYLKKILFIYITQSKISYVLYTSVLYDMLMYNIHYLILRMLRRLPHLYRIHNWRKHPNLSHVHMKHNSLI